MTRPRLLDLFCGAGGAAMGYHRAGFEVVGVDNKPMRRYPFEFIEADAMTFPLAGFDAVHASPPCQKFSRTAHLARAQGNKASEVDLLTPIRPMLRAMGLPYIIENVPGSPMVDPVQLCGSMFGLGVRRHRLFESNTFLFGGYCDHGAQERPVGVYGRMDDDIPYGGRTASTLAEAQVAMGIEWMKWNDLKEAIPPAYTEFLGRQLMAYVMADRLALA